MTCLTVQAGSRTGSSQCDEESALLVGVALLDDPVGTTASFSGHGEDRRSGGATPSRSLTSPASCTCDATRIMR